MLQNYDRQRHDQMNQPVSDISCLSGTVCATAWQDLEIYREDYSEGTFNEILQSLDLDNDMVGDAFGCYCIVDKESLRK